MPTPSPAVQDREISLVYVATCLANGKRYVGVTSRGLRERTRKHIARALAGSELLFHRALRKYGAEAFEWCIDSSGLLWEDACAREPKTGDEREDEKAKMRELHRTRHYGYAFPR